MSTKERAFLAQILAEPADDVRRLVYADWLDENGDPLRAEFIRVQVELARTPKPAERLSRPIIGDEVDPYGCGTCVECERVARQRCRYHKLLNRGNEILKRAARGDLTPVPSRWVCDVLRNAVPRNSIGFSRGFVAEVKCEAGVWLAGLGDAATAAHPIERATLTTWPETEVVGSGWSPDVIRVSLRGRSKCVEAPAPDVNSAIDSTANLILAVEQLLALEWPGVAFGTPNLGVPSPFVTPPAGAIL